MSTAKRIFAVVVLGVAYNVLLTWIYAYGTFVSLFSLAAAKQFGSPSILPTAFSVISAVSWALIVGLLFGVPLGLVVRKQVVGYWLLFVASGAATLLILQLHAGLALDVYFLEWSLPEVWLNLVAVLAYAYVVTYVRQAPARSAIVAP